MKYLCLLFFVLSFSLVGCKPCTAYYVKVGDRVVFEEYRTNIMREADVVDSDDKQVRGMFKIKLDNGEILWIYKRQVRKIIGNTDV